MTQHFYCRIFITIFLLSILTGCRSNTIDSLPCEENTRCLVYGITSDILILDPHISDSTDAGIVFRQIYDTLIYRDPVSYDFIPGLAQSWEVSDDGLDYTFNLRQDVVFQDGTLFNAESVARNIDRIFDPNLNSTKSKLLLGTFSRYEIVDDYTIRFYLFEPYSPLLDSLSQPYLSIVSPTSLEEYSDLRYQFHQVGSGPFQLDNYLPGDRIELSRNPNYQSQWSSIYMPLLGDEIDQIIFKIIPDSTSQTNALVTRAVDIIGNMLPSDVRILSNNSALEFIPIEIPGQSIQFMFNTQQNHTENPIVRQALLYATNRIAIVDEVFLNFSSVAWSPLSQSTRFSHTGYINVFTFDALLASDLLSSVGYADTDGDGFLDLNGVKLELSILVPPWGQLPQVASLLREQWRVIGIDLIIEPMPGLNSLLNRLATGDYHLSPFDNFGLEPSILNTTFISSSTNNISRYVNEDLDALLILATQERDQLARRNQYFEIQAMIMENTLVLPIRDYVNVNGVQANIRNIRYDAYGWYPILHNVSKMQSN